MHQNIPILGLGRGRMIKFTVKILNFVFGKIKKKIDSKVMTQIKLLMAKR
jgi:hypothetical protein